MKNVTKIGQVYRCELCGNIVEVLHQGAGQLVCCGEPMTLMEEKTEDSSVEKHVPYIEETEDGIIVRIGENEDHPMTEDHYIEWIQITADDVSYRKFLNPSDQPKAKFDITAEEIVAREYCNVHGLWKS